MGSSPAQQAVASRAPSVAGRKRPAGTSSAAQDPAEWLFGSSLTSSTAGKGKPQRRTAPGKPPAACMPLTEEHLVRHALLVPL